MHRYTMPAPPLVAEVRQPHQKTCRYRRFNQPSFFLWALFFFQGANAAYIEPTWRPHNGPGSYSSPNSTLQAAKDNWDIQWAAHVSCRTWGASHWGEAGNYGSGLGRCASSGGVWAAPSCPSGYFYDRTEHKCWDGTDELEAAQKGPPAASTCVGNPINITTGNKFQTETDHQPGAHSSLSFTRSYNSIDAIWRHGFSSYLRLTDAEHVALVMHHGRESYFTVSRDTVTDHLGNSLSLTEDTDHQPLTLKAPGVQITYGYDAHQRLTSMVRVAGGQTTQRKFHYDVADKPNLLTGITDERGVRYATWTYDIEARAASSERDRVLIVYNADDSSTVTNELGRKTTYRFQTIQRINRITATESESSPNCTNSNSTFTCNDRSLLETKTDNKDVVTTYDYNERGLEVSRAEASGTEQARTVTTERHPSLYLPLAVTESDRITRYQYDAPGRQLSRAIETR